LGREEFFFSSQGRYSSFLDDKYRLHSFNLMEGAKHLRDKKGEKK